MSRAVAKKLSTHPELASRARRYILGRTRKASASERATLEEWDEILTTMSIPRLRRFLTDPGPRATRLRQSLPFVDALSQQEREALRKALRPSTR